jgi:hypothetical protein
MFDVVLALDGISNVVKLFEIDEPLQAISFGEAFDVSGAMLEDPMNEIARHPDIVDAVGLIVHDVNVAARHADILQDVDGRDKPGHNGYLLMSPRS